MELNFQSNPLPTMDDLKRYQQDLNFLFDELDQKAALEKSMMLTGGHWNSD